MNFAHLDLKLDNYNPPPRLAAPIPIRSTSVYLYLPCVVSRVG